ncbi:hypothetical protein jhhlp_003739 [Lomentospora prolificans]|uniref:Pentatricopeptide repeat-containing protein-mitochondrial domain-containing protein n=1 Tax=Lomentospora prolificans TaxID=41688 RepID=A0A2N3N9L8_9PEZI|nr:hypothetical protein jhhlp_003739 [Lomentospora prolificans]
MRGSRIVFRRQWRPANLQLSNTHVASLTGTAVFRRQNWSDSGPPRTRLSSRPPPANPSGWGSSQIRPRQKLETPVETDPSATENAVDKQETLGWSREAFRAFLDDKGSSVVLARFQELAARQLDTKGRAGTLVEALKEMRALGIRPNPAFYGLALAALAVHPDYLLRATILDAMRKDWVEFTPDHRIHVVLGMLRDGQYEMAFDELEELVAEEVPVSYWFYEVFVYAFGKLGFLEEAMRALEYREQQADAPAISPNLLYYLLDACSAAYHHHGTTHFWKVAVKENGIVPSDGTLLNVINTAARHTDPELALEALRVTTDRRVQLSFQHFEPIIEAYAGVGDLAGAFRILCVMDRAGIRPGRDATRCLFDALRNTPDQVDACVDILKSLGKSYRVPIAAFNVLVEVLCSSGDIASAEALYNDLPSITTDPPTVTTFHPFLTSAEPSIEICMTAIESFPNLTLPPPDLSKLTLHLARTSLDAALAYLRRIDAVYKPPRSHPARANTKPDAWILYADAVRAVAVEMFRHRDPRTWEFFSEMGRRNPALAAELRELGRGVGEAVAGETA